jgi:hypothetical protein
LAKIVALLEAASLVEEIAQTQRPTSITASILSNLPLQKVKFSATIYEEKKC